jgi:protein regulator of cytokinesis 1
MTFDQSNDKTLKSTEFWVQSNREYETIFTPPKKIRGINDGLDASTLNNSLDETEQEPNEHQFDKIITNVNQTIQELNEVYNKIGYSVNEINNKKSEIFAVIQDTINNFASTLQREKNNIENECEWLRQQIQVILSMISDPSGLQTLTMLERGLIFNDETMYQQGYKQDLKDQLIRNQNFLVSSPFNVSQIENDDKMDCSLQQQYEYMTKNITEVSLLTLRNKLNNSFLKVLEEFIKLFSKFNEMNLQYIEVSSYIDNNFDNSNKIVKSFPTKDEAEQHRALIQKFDELIKNLSKTNISYKNNTDETFILSSPRKPNMMRPHNLDELNDNLSHLREVNYQIVRVIRSLKFTKISPDLLSNLQSEIQKCKNEIDLRASKVAEIVTLCLEYIFQLQITDEQLTGLQKHHKLSQDTTEEEYFEIETLNFIKSNPRQFGLNDSHISFLSKFSNLLQKIKETKERKKESYLKHCRYLWDKLGENNDYINKFIQVNSSLTDASLMNYKMELNKLYLKRSEFIDKFIGDSRAEIEDLWRKLYFSEDQRMAFEFYDYNSDNATQDKELVLSIHEQEVSKLKDLYSLQEPIFKLYSELNDLIRDQEFLQESSKDSARLLSKNSCKILLNEEKIRKKINKNMPKVFAALKSEISKYNNQVLKQSKQPIQINGEDFFERVLILESEYGRPNFTRNRNNNLSPAKSVSSIRASPSTFRSPDSSMKTKNISRSLNKLSPTKLSPTKDNHVAKPVLKRPSEIIYTNPTKLKLANAINSSLSSNSSISSLESPRTTLTLNTSMHTLGNIQLIPLNSPLKLNHDTLLYNRNQNNENSPQLKNLPLQSKQNTINNSTSLPSKPLISSADKENPTSILHSPGEFDPSFFNASKKINFDDSPRISTLTGDSSGFLEADYQSWRNERLKQINK